MQITDELIDYLCVLSRLKLTGEEREGRKKDLGDILQYMEKLNELDTDGVREMTHPFEEFNYFREDMITNGDDRENLMTIAPERKGDYFKVKKAVD
jgi:aspartyl-tRNA(Asn)/glutamyl-tRNA(Gln) amidotransferase subunit C